MESKSFREPKKNGFGLPQPLWRAVLAAVLAMVLVLGAGLLLQWDSSFQFGVVLGAGIAAYAVALVVPVLLQR